MHLSKYHIVGNRVSKLKFSFCVDPNKLQECLQSLLDENQQLCTDAACTSLSATRLQQRLAVLERYFSALSRQTPPEKSGPSKKSQANQTNLNKQKWWVRKFNFFVYSMLITYANSLDPDYARQNVRFDLDPNCLTFERMFWKKLILKKKK